MVFTRFGFIFFLFCFISNVTCADDSLVAAQVAVKHETLSGFTRARTRLVLSAESAGRIQRVAYDTGDVIRSGDPFACIDDTFANLDLKSNREEIESLNVDIDFYTKEVKRFSQLFKKKSSSEAKVDSAERSLRKAKAQREMLRHSGKILKEKINRLCIQPPPEWHVIKRYVQKGQWVNAGEPIVEVGDYTHLTAPFALSMAEYQALQDMQDDGIDVFLPELNEKVPAKVIRVSPAFDKNSRKIHLELELSKGISMLRGGLRVELSLNIPMFTGAVLVPKSSIKQQYERYWLTRSDGKEVSVVYLGGSAGEESDLIRVVSPEIKPGDMFLLVNE